jgi:heme/copper-type cytochrome/quinol oxidase subunit 2
MSRYLIVLALLLAVILTAVISQLGGTSHRAAGASSLRDPEYQVCAADVDGIWRYTYGGRCATSTGHTRPYSYHDLVLPSGSTVQLTVERASTAHTLRIAPLRLTLHADKRSSMRATFRTPRATSMYSGRCVSGCGHDRKFASTNVAVIPPQRFKRWLETQNTAIAAQHAQVPELRAKLIHEGIFAANAPQ